MAEIHTDNILRTFNARTSEEYHDGMTWYDTANMFAREISPDDVWRGAGIISSFSPLTSWPQNVILVNRLMANNGVMEGGTLATSIKNATRIYNGEPTMEVLRGDKTRAFASAIADPANSTIATIDRHAYDVAMGAYHTDSTRKIGKNAFRELSAAYVDAAFWVGIGVAQMQAITWLTHRRIKGVKV